MKIRFTGLLLLVLLAGHCAWSQFYHPSRNTENHPAIGKPVYNFTIKDVRNYPQKEIRLQELKGQNIILDFWHKECVACIKSFPKMNALQKQFKDEVKIILVGLEDETGKIRGIYDLLKKRYNLDFIHAFDSSAFWSIVPGGGAPHLVWIDKEGIVRAVTNQASENDIRDFVSGKSFEFVDYSYAASSVPRGFNGKKPLLVDGNGGEANDFAYRSLMYPHTPDKTYIGHYGSVERSLQISGMLQGTYGMKFLYRLAYTGEYDWWMGHPVYGKVSPDIILEIKDSSRFVHDTNKFKNVYTYSLVVPPPKATVKHIMEIMQRDLKNYFGFDASLETRMMPYWRLEASESAKKKIKFKPEGSAPGGDFDYTGFNLINHTMLGLMQAMFGQCTRTGPPVIDKTGITGTFDFELKNVRLNEFDEVAKALKEKGFYLIKDEMPMKVIVIRDPKD